MHNVQSKRERGGKNLKEYARSFYTGKQWKETSKAFMTSKNYICERCGAVATICHHIKYITPENITDPFITLNWENLEALCIDCHNAEHTGKASDFIFNYSGEVRAVKETPEINEFKKAQSAIDNLLNKLKAQNN